MAKLKNTVKDSKRVGAKSEDPIQKAKKGSDAAKIIPDIRWVIEKTIVSTGLCICKWGDNGEVVI